MSFRSIPDSSSRIPCIIIQVTYLLFFRVILGSLNIVVGEYIEYELFPDFADTIYSFHLDLLRYEAANMISSACQRR